MRADSMLARKYNTLQSEASKGYALCLPATRLSEGLARFLPTVGPLPALAHSLDDCIRE
jgi:hypothetical protein